MLDLSELVSCDEPAPERLLSGLPQEIRIEVLSGAVGEGAASRDDRDGPDPGSLLFRDVHVMQDDTDRDPEAPLPPPKGEGEVDLRGQDVGEAVESEGGLMREDPRLFGPEPDDRQVLMLASGVVDQAVDPAPNSRHAAGLEVLLEKLGRVPGQSSLGGGEVALLGARRSVESVPVG